MTGEKEGCAWWLEWVKGFSPFNPKQSLPPKADLIKVGEEVSTAS